MRPEEGGGLRRVDAGYIGHQLVTSSVTTVPSFMPTVRLPQLAARWSCVTMTIVAPRLRFASCASAESDRGAGVEVAGGLVGQDQQRIDDERTRDGHALHLAAGQLVGPMPATVPRPTCSSTASTFGHFGAASGVEEAKQRDVLLRGQRRQQIEGTGTTPMLGGDGRC